MSVAITVSDIISDVEAICDLPVCTSGTFVTAAMMLRFVKLSAQSLGGILGRTWSDGYFVSEGALFTTAGFGDVALPTNFATVKALYWVVGTESYPIELSSPEQWEIAGLDPQTWNPASPPTFRIRGANFTFSPTPNAIYSLRAIYTTGIFISATTDVIQGQVDWIDWIKLDTAIKVRQREQKSAQDFIFERGLVEARLKNASSQQARNATYQVRDVRGTRKSGRWD